MYFFDSYAIIEILRKNHSYKNFEELELIISDLNIGEVYYYLSRTIGKEQTDLWYENLNAKIYPADTNTIVNAMAFRYKNKKKKFSTIDCIGYKLALKHNLKFLTGDKQFKNFNKRRICKKIIIFN